MSWSVWTKVGMVVENPVTGELSGTDALIVSGLTEMQARDIMEHLRTVHGDWAAKVEED